MDRERLDKIKASWDNFKEKGMANFAAFGMDGGGAERPTTLTGDRTKDEVMEWFLNPDDFADEMRDMSRLYYIGNSIYYRTINYYTNLILLDYVLIPDFLEFEESDKEKIIKSKQKVKEYADSILKKPMVRNIIKAVLKDGAYYGYERKEGKVYFFQRLPNEYCREGAIVNGYPSIEFDFKYFDSDEELLELYDSEFTTKYNSYTNGSEGEWQMLDPVKSLCVPMESEDFNFPALTSLFADLMDLDDYFNYMKQATETDVAKILIQKAPMNEETGEMLVEPEDILFFQNAIAEILSDKYKVVSTPFDIDSINFTQSRSGDAGFSGVNDMKRKVMDGAGLSKAILGDTDTSTGLKYNHDVAVSFVFAIVEKIESWINFRLKTIASRKHGFKVGYLRTTGNNRNDVFDSMNDLLSIGGSLFYAIAATGMNPDDYMSLVQLENLLGYKDMLELPGSIYTQPGGKESEGRPEQDEVEETGEETRDTDGNDR